MIRHLVLALSLVAAPAVLSAATITIDFESGTSHTDWDANPDVDGYSESGATFGSYGTLPGGGDLPFTTENGFLEWNLDVVGGPYEGGPWYGMWVWHDTPFYGKNLKSLDVYIGTKDGLLQIQGGPQIYGEGWHHVELDIPATSLAGFWGVNGWGSWPDIWHGTYGVDNLVYSDPTAAPEPATLALLGLGAGALALRRRFRA